MTYPSLIPEFDVSDLARSLDFYVGAIGFEVRYERAEERFAYLVRNDIHLMIEEAAGPGRRFREAPLERPFGRGVNLQIMVDDSAALHARLAVLGCVARLPLEDRWYRRDRVEVGLRQFVVSDPDGYLLRFATELGERPAS